MQMLLLHSERDTVMRDERQMRVNHAVVLRRVGRMLIDVLLLSHTIVGRAHLTANRASAVVVVVVIGDARRRSTIGNDDTAATHRAPYRGVIILSRRTRVRVSLRLSVGGSLQDRWKDVGSTEIERQSLLAGGAV